MTDIVNEGVLLDGHFKKVYADNLNDLRPAGVKLLNRIEFIKKDKMTGESYNQPCILSHEQGFTYGGTGGTAFALRGSVASASKNASVSGHEMVLKSTLSIGAASRSVKGGQAAFIDETKLIVENMIKSTARRLEIQLLYGQTNIGVIESVTANTFVVAEHEWASGIWSGAENAFLAIHRAGGAHLQVQVQSVDMISKTITIVAGVDLVASGVAADDVITFDTAATSAAGVISYNEFAGIHKIITATDSIFGINPNVYSLWKGNVVNVGESVAAPANLSFAKIEEAVTRSMEKGLVDEDVVLLCTPGSWKQLIVEQDAKRAFDSSYSKEMGEQGSKEIKFYGPNGIIEVLPSIYVKRGYAYILPLQEFTRIGSTDVTFEQPGMGGKFFKLMESANGYEFRCYTDQALFTSKPGLCTVLQYITEEDVVA